MDHILKFYVIEALVDVTVCELVGGLVLDGDALLRVLVIITKGIISLS